MRKLMKAIPLLAIGLVAAFAAAGCAGGESERSAVKSRTMVRASAAAYSVPDGVCDHTYEAFEVIAPTCTEQGYTVYVCTDCGASYTDDFTAAKGHTFRDIVMPPTCTQKGYTTHFCTVCGYEYSDTFVSETGIPIRTR